DSKGESTYNPQLPDVVQELVDGGVAVESDGALCVFTDGVTGPGGDRVPLIIRKRDGGYGYATTDLATIRHRAQDLKADQILYVVDARQALHFRMVFDTARRAGWLPEGARARHVAFGTVLGPDGKPFKTRSGGTVRLGDLLDAAVAKARAAVAEKNPDMPAAQLDEIAERAGIAAVKYADLSTSRTKDYSFDVDRMVSLTGDTGVYLQYAHTRLKAILRKADTAPNPSTVDATLPLHPAERALALHLDGYAATLAETAELLEPHRLARLPLQPCENLHRLLRHLPRADSRHPRPAKQPPGPG
ncbi:MAG: arginine--tRNA ligase, partial [Micromonosporaceae bacterium]